MPPNLPLFAGLVTDEYDQPVETAQVGDEAMYVVNDAGFRRHVPAAPVDRAVLAWLAAQVEGHEDVLTEQAAKMVGADDIFSRALLENQFKNISEQMERVLQAGIPEEARAYLGMTGLKIRINRQGDLLEVIQPGLIAPDEE